MKTVTLTLNDLDPKKAQQIIAMLGKKADAVTTDDDDDEDEDEETTTTTRRSGKGKVRASSTDDDEDEDDTEDDDEDDDTDEDDGPTMAMVMSAFKAFTKKNKGNKKPSIAILKKFNVKSPSELDEEDFDKVLKLLKK